MRAIGYVVTGALLLAAVLTGNARANDQFYITAGLGRATLEQSDLNGHWFQEGYAYSFDEQTNAWKIGAGWQWKPWLAFEADWRDLGEFNSVARFTSDKNYDWETKGCKNPCEPTRTGWQNGTARGLGLSAVVSYPATITPFARVGLFVHHVKFRSFISREADPFDRTLYASDYADNFERIGVRGFGGLGLRYKNIEAEFTYYPQIGTNETAFQNASSFLLSARF